MKANRRPIVTNQPGQTRMILAMVGPLNICLSLLLLLVTVFCFRLDDEASEAGVQLTNLTPLYAGVAILIVLVAGVMFVSSVKISHRIAGPTTGIRNTLQAVRGGDRSRRVTLRKGDFLLPLANELNEFLDWVEASGTGPEQSPPVADESPATIEVQASLVIDAEAEAAVHGKS